MSRPTTDSQLARLELSGPKNIPILTSCELTIEVYIRWKDACEDHFNVKAIAADKQVAWAVSGFEDMLMRDWFRAEKTRLLKLNWEDFTAEFKNTWLPENWEQNTRNQLTRACQGMNDPFRTWVVKVETMNSVLADTPSHKDKTQLRNHIESLMCDRLAQMATAANKRKMIALDNERMATMDEIRRVTARPLNPSTKNNSATTSSSSRPSFSCTREHPPPLTESERDLLYKHFGCFKCRRFYARHKGKDCTNPFIKASDYQELTEADTLRAKKDHDKKRNNAPKRATTAAVNFDENLDDYTAAAMRILMRSEIADTLKLCRRKLLNPVTLNSAWGSKGAHVSHYVKLCFSLRSFAWTSRSVRCLVVDELCAPIILGMPFLSHNDLIINVRRCTVIDSALGFDLYSALGFDLCNPDYRSLRSPASTPTPTSHSPPVIPTPLPDIHPSYLVRGAKPRTSTEPKKGPLSDGTSTAPTTDLPLHTAVPLFSSNERTAQIVAAMRTTIEVLAHGERLQQEEDRCRKKFHDIFPSRTPRLDELPNDVFHRFKLKDPNLVISKHA
ncbi:hypothetical protein BDY19DRAFT_998285 [Irpex rosettiformis]|uniref:Uncharacterized protein n=1 Tax=Irpex rosettiformis TaxID=378272 RepID=A0ACB8TP62_9APHY|nr:hypothetical protein BDY19DRAFT_998285 [Irpex rosettiformis]